MLLCDALAVDSRQIGIDGRRPIPRILAVSGVQLEVAGLLLGGQLNVRGFDIGLEVHRLVDAKEGLLGEDARAGFEQLKSVGAVALVGEVFELVQVLVLYC
jgi:hypothetical protein